MRSFIVLSLVLLGGIVMTGPLQAQHSADDVEALLMNELRGGSYLGVGLADIDADRAKALKLDEPRGVEVTRVEEGSPAEKAGIKPGDVLLSYNGENILGAQQLGRLVRETPEGRSIRIQLWRDGKTQSLTVVTAAHHFDVPTQFTRVPMPKWPNMAMFDVPAPLLMWKNPAFGIECEPVDSQLAQYFGVKRGVLVRSVEKGSAAEKAGLKAGDVLTAVGGKPVATPRDLSTYMRTQHEPEKSVPVVLTRDHKELTLQIQPADYQQQYTFPE